jgi:hypothetical protein
LQFTFAIVLTICTIIVKQQIDHARNRETGYNKNNLIYHFLTPDLSKNYALVKNELLSSGIAESVTKTNSPLTERWSNGWGQSWEGKNPDDRISFDRYWLMKVRCYRKLTIYTRPGFRLKKFPTDSTQ